MSTNPEVVAKVFQEDALIRIGDLKLGEVFRISNDIYHADAGSFAPIADVWVFKNVAPLFSQLLIDETKAFSKARASAGRYAPVDIRVQSRQVTLEFANVPPGGRFIENFGQFLFDLLFHLRNVVYDEQLKIAARAADRSTPPRS